MQRRHADALLAIRGVVGTGVGLGADGGPEIRVFTVEPGIGLPATLEGVPVRAHVSGRLYARRGASCDASGDAVCDTDERWPLPVPIGVSIGHPDITAGTIGARVTDGVNVLALSNNHVLANGNLAAVGDPALQPGPFDGGSVAAGDAIGTLHDFEPIHFCEIVIVFLVCEQANRFDAAVAIASPSELGVATPLGEYGSAPGYGAPSATLHAAYGDPGVEGDEDLGLLLGLPVQKYGRTTRLTSGVIDTVQLTADVCYDDPCTLVARFEDQLSVPGSFSASGDSGSLVVSDDDARQPVGLLFAGSATQTLVSRIDHVLLRFGVGIDDGASAPITDAELVAIAAPSYALVDETTSIGIDVRNAGSEPLPGFDVVFTDATESTTAVLAAPALDPGASARLEVDWTPTETGPHTLEAVLQLGDDEPGNDQATAQVDVRLEPPGLSLRLWRGTARTDAWTPVSLDLDYGNDMVVVCTPSYDATALGPMVTRVRNASGSGFEVGLGRPWFGAFPGDHGSAEVHCMVVRAGVYAGRVRMEAVRIDGFAAKDDVRAWVGEARAYAQSYLSPVVIGQVISQGVAIPGEIGVFSTFWARGASALDPPSPTALFVGRHTGEDPTPRAPEALAYVVLEAGSGWIQGTAYTAGVGPDSVRGVDDAPPYDVPLAFLTTATVGVASPSGMNGAEGGWPILYGADAVASDALGLAIEEDWYLDSERSHPTEQVGYVVFGTRTQQGGGRGCGLGFEVAALLVLVPFARPRGRRRATRTQYPRESHRD
ncbi:MAG: hypothetical protein JSU66_16510 [Deltaproteobacteria bacterium]|nr:MAG: hypothetical protein JSU66_16510 [Deltaproteobacteria bacterium]